MAGSAVYPSCARLGASRPPQHVQVETPCRRVGGPHSPAVWQHQPKREPWRLSPVRRKTVYEKGGAKLSGRKSTRALTVFAIVQGEQEFSGLEGLRERVYQRAAW